MVEFKNIFFHYKEGIDVLTDLSCSVKKGAITALLGPNGMGKTTLINVALGWLKPYSGSVLVGGRSINTFAKNELSRVISLVPQQESIPFSLSVIDYVLFGRAPYLNPLESPGEEDYLIARNALEKLDILNLSGRSIMNLSGGEKQLVLIARSLTQQTDCLLMDEPSSHLDPANRIAALKIMKSLGESGITILFSTHNPDEVLSIADYAMCMNDASSVIEGLTEDIITEKNLSELYGVNLELMKSGSSRFLRWHI